MDRNSRALYSKEATEVARDIYSIYCRQGAPVQTISDNGREFTNKISKALHEAYDCKLIFSTPYHPQTNGLVESSHKSVKGSLVKSLNEKNDNWSLFLEEITFSINIRPRITTSFSAFELMHGSRKPRLPTQAQSLTYQYPEDTGIGECAVEEQMEQLINFMQDTQESNNTVALENLSHSQTLMKQQYDKKLNRASFRKLEIGDSVLIENRKTKGGKLQDKWLGPYSVTKVTSTNVHILRNNYIQRVKRSKVKLLKRSSIEITEELPPTKYQCMDNRNDDDSFQSISDENILIPPSPFHGIEESIFETNLIRKSREEVLEFLNLMKVRIIDSIKTNTPLSELHRQLDKRIDLPFKELFDWRQCHFPPTNIPENRLMAFDTT